MQRLSGALMPTPLPVPPCHPHWKLWALLLLLLLCICICIGKCVRGLPLLAMAKHSDLCSLVWEDVGLLDHKAAMSLPHCDRHWCWDLGSRCQCRQRSIVEVVAVGAGDGANMDVHSSHNTLEAFPTTQSKDDVEQGRNLLMMKTTLVGCPWPWRSDSR